MQVVPLSVVYDQLHEVSLMTEEARGANKTPEDWRWLVRFARLQRNRLGRAYLTVGEPFSLRERMAELAAEGVTGHQAVERVALDISHRLNRATPVTTTAIVSLALLGADRALTVDEVLDTVEPLAAYIDARHWPVAGAADLRDRSTIRRALAELTRSGVLTAYDRGTEPVWKIGDDQHLVAAFYRNTVIHILVERAIGELALLTVSELEPGAELPPGGELQVGWEEAKRMRDLLKFEFFFPSPRRLRGRPPHRAPAAGRRGGHRDDAGQGARAARAARVRTWPTSCCGRSSTPTSSSPTASPTAATDPSTRPTCSPTPWPSASSGRCSDGWPARSRSRSSSSAPRWRWPATRASSREARVSASAREAFAAELRDSVRRVNVIGEIAGEPTIAVPSPAPVPAPAGPDPRQERT